MGEIDAIVALPDLTVGIVRPYHEAIAYLKETSLNAHHSINYIELPATDLIATKAFFGSAFGWTFQDWGDTYISFEGAGINGGFDADSGERKPSKSGVLVVLYSDDLAVTEKSIVDAGGTISVPAFGFPGGRRFHFLDPNGNELAVWTPAE